MRVAQCTISGIVFSVCRALYEELVDDFMRVPTSEAEWKAIATSFQKMWNFPLCIGALDGKHVKIIPPVNSGSHFFNYKGSFSIVLLALVDANLRFIYVDAGTNGRCSDGGVWAKSDLKKCLDTNALHIPEASYLPGTNIKVPYVIVADDAFPLTPNIMKPFSGRNLSEKQVIFNYRLSRARRIVENAFGILANRFRIYKSEILASPLKERTFVLTTCVLHNFLRNKIVAAHNGNFRNDPDFRPSNSSTSCIRPLNVVRRPQGTFQAKQVRDWFCNYFNTTGSVPWQRNQSKYH